MGIDFRLASSHSFLPLLGQDLAFSHTTLQESMLWKISTAWRFFSMDRAGVPLRGYSMSMYSYLCSPITWYGRMSTRSTTLYWLT